MKSILKSPACTFHQKGGDILHDRGPMHLAESNGKIMINSPAMPRNYGRSSDPNASLYSCIAKITRIAVTSD